jgi:hypothetical protein
MEKLNPLLIHLLKSIPTLTFENYLAFLVKLLISSASPQLTSIAASGRAVVATGLIAMALVAQQPAATAAPTNYSNDKNAPTQVFADSRNRYTFDGQVAGTGLNTASCAAASPSVNCVDYITINIPSASYISRINLDYYNSTDDRAFIGFQAGNKFTADQATGAGMLAYNHFGWRGQCSTTYGSLRPTGNSINTLNNCIDSTNTTPVTSPTTTNLLTKVFVSTQLNSPTPTPSQLGSGDYTFWIQQVSGDSRYTITVESVPGPLPVVGAAAAFGWSRRLRRRLRGQSRG